MYFDYLTDNIKEPKLVLLECNLDGNILDVTSVFVRAYIYNTSSFVMKDKRGWDILRIVTPPVFLGLNYGKMFDSTDKLRLQLAVDKIYHGHG